MIHRGVFAVVILAFFTSTLAKSSVEPIQIKLGDEAFRERQSPEQARLALESYRAAYLKTPSDPEVAWRLAMACYFVGLRLTQDADTKRSLFAEGRDAGEKSISLAPHCAACHFWTAINSALYGQTVGVFKMLFSLDEIRDHLKATIDIDPSYAYGGAYRVLGLIEQKLPGILGGSNTRARDDFQKAVAVAPDEPLNYLFLARLLKDEFNAPQGAYEVARQALTLPAPTHDRLESREALADLKALIEAPR